MPKLAPLTEQQIQKARPAGRFDALEGAGKPLPDRPGNAFVSAGAADGFRFMAQAGVVPEEIAVKKQIAALRARLDATRDPCARREAMAELARLQMRMAIASEARRRFLRD
ncbi:DUF1992 domain-containing protein [Thalassococcus sp. CAU 1522]|uniref:DUF1992 domain-containing protein n=1 Tax=Thalassococcus arenae TaxID=2851652 RepID=A0ABS6N7I4_9RHOB|nr:DUF1992 domain-containing protein [Thalassococcus arenae]MBV2359977.1 DUF1992 domain-containing protein [Thalassococcus arenae]